jgi:hypothetical protein
VMKESQKSWYSHMGGTKKENVVGCSLIFNDRYDLGSGHYRLLFGFS